MTDGQKPSVGQIVETQDVSSIVVYNDWHDRVANSALLDTRITQLFPSESAARKAAEAQRQ